LVRRFEIDLALADIYDSVEFIPEPAADEAG
jgi:hypothetical protein